MRWRRRAPTASKIARIHKNYTRLEYYPETTEEQANVFKKGILQSGNLLWGLEIFWMKANTITEFGFRMKWRIIPSSEVLSASAFDLS